MDAEFLKWYCQWQKAIKLNKIFDTVCKHGHKTFQERKKLRTQKIIK